MLAYENRDTLTAHAAVYAAKSASPAHAAVIYDCLGGNRPDDLGDFFSVQPRGEPDSPTFHQWTGSLDESTQALVKAHYASLQGFKSFIPRVMQLRLELADCKPAEHQAYLGSGRTADVFRLSERHAVRLVRSDIPPAHRAGRVSMLVGSLLAVRGMPAVEQLRAHAYSPDAIITRLEHGMVACRLDAQEIAAVTNGDFYQALETIDQLTLRGLRLSAEPGALRYRPGQGFRFLHPQLAPAAGVEVSNVVRFARSFTYDTPYAHHTVLPGLGWLVRQRYPADFAVQAGLQEVCAAYQR